MWIFPLSIWKERRMLSRRKCVWQKSVLPYSVAAGKAGSTILPSGSGGGSELLPTKLPRVQKVGWAC